MQEMTCPHCTGRLALIDPINKIWECAYCGNRYDNQRNPVINNFTNNIYMAGNTYEDKLKTADELVNVHQAYEEAMLFYDEAAKMEPARYEAWWGLARAWTQDFQHIDCGEECFRTARGYARRGIRTADEKTAPKLSQKWMEYEKKYQEFYETAQEHYNQVNDTMQQELDLMSSR